jgi:hypothetical protein
MRWENINHKKRKRRIKIKTSAWAETYTFGPLDSHMRQPIFYIVTLPCGASLPVTFCARARVAAGRGPLVGHPRRALGSFASDRWALPARPARTHGISFSTAHFTLSIGAHPSCSLSHDWVSASASPGVMAAKTQLLQRLRRFSGSRVPHDGRTSTTDRALS